MQAVVLRGITHPAGQGLDDGAGEGLLVRTAVVLAAADEFPVVMVVAAGEGLGAARREALKTQDPEHLPARIGKRERRERGGVSLITRCGFGAGGGGAS